MHHTATLTAVTKGTSPRHGAVYSLHVTCDRCGRNNLHGGGTDPALLASYLGHRVADCGCPGGYFITDPRDLTAQETGAPVVSDGRVLTAAEWLEQLRATLAESAARREREAKR